jgi:sugar phosphate isomerase/epimerase
MFPQFTKPTLGFLTVARDMGVDPTNDLSLLASNMEFAQQNRYGALEVAMFPKNLPGVGPRDFNAETLKADWVTSQNVQLLRDKTNKLKEKTGVQLESLCYCDNMLGNEHVRTHFKNVIQSAVILEVPTVVGFIGNVWPEIRDLDIKKSDDKKNYVRKAINERIGPLITYADDHGIRVEFENCPMGHYQRNNLFACPSDWNLVLDEQPKARMRFDPSHIRNYRPNNDADPSAEKTITQAIETFGYYLTGVHLKDGKDNIRAQRSFYSLGNPYLGDDTHTAGLWIAKIPGEGQIKWDSFENAIKTFAPKTFVRSVELEDPAIIGREANESALKRVSDFYSPLLNN